MKTNALREEHNHIKVTTTQERDLEFTVHGLIVFWRCQWSSSQKIKKATGMLSIIKKEKISKLNHQELI